MDALKKFFPLSFSKAGSTNDLVVGIIIYIVIGLIAGLVLGFAGLITGWIPLLGAVIGWVLRAVCGVIDLYCLIGLVLLVLKFLKVIN